MKRILPVLLTLALLLTGCWDVKEVQSANFITALGIDYVKEKYVIYAQMLGFAEISKQESPSKDDEPNIWIGRAEGQTMAEALNNLYPASQQLTLWTHVKSIVFSKSLLEHALPDTLAGLLRSRDLRYTPWVFGTDKDMDKLFSSFSLMNHSILNSELMDPMEVYRQYSAIKPMRLIKLINGVNEPAVSALLPSIVYTETVWKNKTKPISLAELNGVYVITKGKSAGFIDSKQMNGIRFTSFNRKMYKYPLSLTMPDGTKAVLNIIDAKSNSRFDITSSRPLIRMKVKARANVVETAPNSETTAEIIKKLALKKIEHEIRNTFLEAQRKGLDVYGLEETLYRKHHAGWKQLKAASATPVITRLNLDRVEIDLKVVHSTSYKLPHQ